MRPRTMKKLTETTYKQFYSINEFVARNSPMRTHYLSKNPLERYIWQSKLRAIKKMLGAISYDNVLDVGCGDGELLQIVGKACGYIGVDISPTQLKNFRNNLSAKRKKRSGQIKLIQHNVQELPFAPASFDLVLACDVLEHVLEPGQVLLEIQRVLKPGGHALFSLPNEPVWQWLRLLFLRWPPRSPDHLYFIEKKDVIRIFPVVKNEAYIPGILSRTHLLYLLLVEKKDRFQA